MDSFVCNSPICCDHFFFLLIASLATAVPTVCTAGLTTCRTPGLLRLRLSCNRASQSFIRLALQVMKITLLEALVGFKKTFRHMDDHEVEVSRMEVTPHGHVMIVKDEGMPKHNVPSEVVCSCLLALRDVVLVSTLVNA